MKSKRPIKQEIGCKFIRIDNFYGLLFVTNPWTHKIEDLNGETVIGSFDKKELLLSNL